MELKKYICSACVAGVLTLMGCNDLFRDAPVDQISEEAIWENAMLLDEYVLPWYRNMNHGFSTYVPTTISLIKSMSRYYMPWFGDQIVPSKTDYYNAGYGDLLKANQQEITNWAEINWQTYYTQIQSVNRLLENQDKIAEGSQKQRVLGEAHFFRAYYYFLLWRLHGGVMLIHELFDPLNDGTTYPRASYTEMVQAITADARTAADLLQQEYDNTETGRITKGAALMLVAKTYQWASSERFQNQEKDYQGFTNDQSRAMLDSAKTAYEQVMGLQQYSLIQISGTTQDAFKQEYRNIFLTKNSQESILEVQHSDDGNYDTGFGHKLDRDAASPYFTGTTAAYTPTQNHVDEYGMRQGYTYDARHPYVGRDWRFYANVLYDGSEYNGHVMDIHTTDGVSGVDLTAYGTSSTASVTRTGYYMGKFVNESQVIDNDDTYASSQDYIIWRYAEVLLDYAEVMFRLGDTGTALQMVNQIRSRAHMDALSSLTWDELVNERRVELAFEETSYWDIMRWGIAEEKLNGSTNPILAMTVEVNTATQDTTYTIGNMDRFPTRVRIFDPRQYYLPLHWDDVRYHGVEQNPDWTEM